MAQGAVITGGAQGIGKVIDKLLGNDVYHIVISYMNMDLAEKTIEEFKNQNIKAIAVQGDVSKQEDQFSVVQKAVDEFGSVDVFINNAGIDQVEAVEDITPGLLECIYNINVFGHVYGYQAVTNQ